MPKKTYLNALFFNLNRFKLSRTILNIVFVLALVLLTSLSFLAHYHVKTLIKSNNWVTHTYQVINSIESALYYMVDIESHQRAFIILQQDHELNIFDALKDDLRKNVEQLIYLTKDNPSQQARADVFKRVVEQRLQLLIRIIKLKQSGRLIIHSGIFNDSIALSNQVKALGQEMKSVEMTLLKERDNGAFNQTKNAQFMLTAGSIISFILLAFAFLLVNKELAAHCVSEKTNDATQARLNKIINSVSDMIAAFDNNHCFIIFNDAYKNEFKRLFNKTIYIGMNLNEAFNAVPQSKKKIANIWQTSLLRNDFNQMLEVTLDDAPCYYEISSNFVEDAHNTIGVVQNVRNITKRIQEHTKLQDSYEKQALSLRDLQEKNTQITLLVEMSDIMLACNSQEEITQVLGKYPQILLPFTRGYLYAMHPSKNYLEQSLSWGAPHEQNVTFQPDDCWAIKLGRQHKVNHATQELTCSHVVNQNDDYGYLCLPLMAQNDIYGLLYLEGQTHEGTLFNANESLLINAFAELTALALANVRLRDNLRHQSIRDPLTALYNRRYLDDFLFKQLHQAKRSHLSFAILMLDLDHFKKINDTYGHDAGDMVLKEAGKILQNNVRAGDIATRYGGEEFIVLLYDINQEHAVERAEAIRHDIAQINIKYGAQIVGPITTSVGIALFPLDADSPKELIEAADKALYFAKKTGRNKLVLYHDLKPNQFVY
ncbi:MAG: diguanylate cyclase [Legionellaceae bacterium]|nr:diguanylate cyclase [Legionellaceae bacterium]|tara:strand:- start:8101 stop:10236 length:2136 start_codon:yes stop_codon:yes gene_type:complete